MKVLCHRGLWKTPAEQNTVAAFRRAFSFGFGLETDVRDCLGDIVISHDPPGGGEMRLEELLRLHAEYDCVGTLALNIKADGLCGRLESLLQSFQKVNAFVFDMSLPDALSYLGRTIPVFTRQSEYERECSFYEQAAGVWLDAFHGDWCGATCAAAHLRQGKQVCFVSPEVHGRDPRPLWGRLVSSTVCDSPDLMICTDRPEDARAMFSR